MFKERRKHHRIPISDVILFRRENGARQNRFLTAEARDISEGGVYFLADELLFEGERIELTFRERNAFVDTRVHAEVVRVLSTAEGYGIGARFLPSVMNAHELATGQSAVR